MKLMQHKILQGNEKMLPLLSSLLRLPPVNVLSILSESRTFGEKVLARLHRLRVTALLCLQNVLEVLPPNNDVVASSSSPLIDVWTGVMSILSEESAAAASTPLYSSVDLVEAATSALRAVVLNWAKNVKCFEQQLFTPEALNVSN
jgi:hypothetical protein